MPNKATRLDRLPPYVFVTISQQIQELTQAGHRISRLDIGNPDMPPPPHVVEALYQNALDDSKHGYAGYRGIVEFRQAVASYYKRRFNVLLDPETEVLPLLGSKEGIVNLCLAYLDNGDTALIPAIGYPAYAMATRIAGANIAWVKLDESDNFLPKLDEINPKDAQNAKMLWINYPNNPTGGIADSSFYQRAVDFCNEHDILLASDNPYVEITYGSYVAGSALEALGALECTVEFMSFSKTYNMAGWRLGAAVGNAEALKNLLHVKSNMDSGHFKAVYHAGINALEKTTPEWIAERNQKYCERRDKILAALPQVGLEAATPQGSMYIWAKVLNGTEEVYIREALTEAHVSLAPGAAYGSDGGGYVRISVGVADEQLDEALKSFKKLVFE